MKEIVLVNNGGCYSDYGIKGIVLVNKKDKARVQDVITEAHTEYTRLHHEAREAEEEARRHVTGVIVKYPSETSIIKEFCEKNNMKYIEDYLEVSFEDW
ncbi:MAG: hypothetical protein WC365_01330 [Candidatus Babeliales bacterium]|jgi:hypothetical protein